MGKTTQVRTSPNRPGEPIAGAAPPARPRVGGVLSGRARSRSQHGGRPPGAGRAAPLAQGRASGAALSRRRARPALPRGLLAFARACLRSGGSPLPPVPTELVPAGPPRRRELFLLRVTALRLHAELSRRLAAAGWRLRHCDCARLLSRLFGERITPARWRSWRRAFRLHGYQGLIDRRGCGAGRRAPIDSQVWRRFCQLISRGYSLRAADRLLRPVAEREGRPWPSRRTIERRWRAARTWAAGQAHRCRGSRN